MEHAGKTLYYNLYAKYNGHIIISILPGVKTMVHRFITLLLVYTLSSHSINAAAYQEKNSTLDNQHDTIAAIQYEMRRPSYSKEILPNDFSFVLQLLSSGKANQQPPLYARSVIQSFGNMIKRSPYVNAIAFSELLQDLPIHLLPYFSLPVSRSYITDAQLYDAAFADRFKITVNGALYGKFSTQYESFRQDPETFLRTLSTDITTLAQEEMVQEQVRQSLIRFCEVALSKLIWDPAAHEATWLTTKRIGEQLARLLECNILDDTNDLEDLHATLLNRYCYFIDITATDMPSSFFAAIKNDLKSRDIILFALTEQDSILESKLAYMQRTLIEAETAAYRHQAGLPRA